MVGGALIGLLDLHSVGGDLGRLICPQPRPAYIQKGSSISWPAGWAPPGQRLLRKYTTGMTPIFVTFKGFPHIDTWLCENGFFCRNML